MSNTRPARPSAAALLRRFSPVLPAVILLLGGCAVSGSGERQAIMPQTPRTVLDGYLMARGMALGYGESGRAGPAELARLVRFDRAALLAVAGAQIDPATARVAQAQQAVQALIDYTAENDMRTAADSRLP